MEKSLVDNKILSYCYVTLLCVNLNDIIEIPSYVYWKLFHKNWVKQCIWCNFLCYCCLFVIQLLRSETAARINSKRKNRICICRSCSCQNVVWLNDVVCKTNTWVFISAIFIKHSFRIRGVAVILITFYHIFTQRDSVCMAFLCMFTISFHVVTWVCDCMRFYEIFVKNLLISAK